MNGDFSRDTFDAAKHYQQVLMQQGRAQLDADWNEQAALAARRDETTAADVMGDCGGPAEGAAFAVFTDQSGLTPAEKAHLQELGVTTPLAAGDFFLSAGRYYVDGVQCENELATTYTRQPDRLDVAALTKGKSYLLYLDVWRRHLTALEDPSIRESALGGPDTATRVKTVWQVRALELPAIDAADPCSSGQAIFDALTDPGTARLAARTAIAQAQNAPCVVPPSAGFTGLENQLYRVEIHETGGAIDVGDAGGTTEVTLPAAGATPADARIITVKGGVWQPGPAELYASKGGSPKLKGQVIWITAVNGKALTLSERPAGFVDDDLPRLRHVSGTWKWSRDNGAVVTQIVSIDKNKITVTSLGPDQHLGFTQGSWIEILDDALELEGKPGRLAQIESVDELTRVITIGGAEVVFPITPGRHAKLRRWDGVGAVKFSTDAVTNWLSIESGVEIQFAATGAYRTGQWWYIPARAATAQSPDGAIEWPTKAGKPLPLAPRGIRHRYCRIATITVKNDGSVDQTDCRCLFRALSAVPRLFYVSGDGQEVMPDLTNVGSGTFYKLRQPLIVGVPNAHCLDQPRVVRFRVTNGAGRVVGTGGMPTVNEVKIPTDTTGLAKCDFHLDGQNANQQVTAALLDTNGVPVSLPIIFNANLSVAREVAYDPGTCAGLAGQKTVQSAVSRLAGIAHIGMLGGDGQDTAANDPLARPLEVSVTSHCGPLQNATVVFKSDAGGLVATTAAGLGDPAATNSVNATTDANGIATCYWKPAPSPATQQATATLASIPGGVPFERPELVRFTANLRERGHGSSCCVEVGPDVGADGYATIEEALKALQSDDKIESICVRLQPGVHKVAGGLKISGGERPRLCVRIEGCGGRCTVVLVEKGPIMVGPLQQFQLRNLGMMCEGGTLLAFEDCQDVTIEACQLLVADPGRPLVSINRAASVRVANSEIMTYSPVKLTAASTIAFPELNDVAPMPAMVGWSDLMAVVDQAAGDLAKTAATPQALDKAVSAISRAVVKAADTDALKVRAESIQTSFKAAATAVSSGTVKRATASLFRPAVLQTITGIAIAIADAEAEVTIVDNRIGGSLLFYGVAAPVAVAQFAELGRMVAVGKVSIVGTDRTAMVRGNVLTNLLVSEELGTGAAAGRAAFGQLTVSDNVMMTQGSELFARGVVLNANRFVTVRDEPVAFIEAAFASIIGNIGDFPSGKIVYGIPKPADNMREAGTNVPGVVPF